VGAAVWIYYHPYSDVLDQIASLDIDFQREKNITLNITKNSPEVQAMEIKRIARKQMTSFIDASVELGLLKVSEQERSILLNYLVEETYTFNAKRNR